MGSVVGYNAIGYVCEVIREMLNQSCTGWNDYIMAICKWSYVTNLVICYQVTCIRLHCSLYASKIKMAVYVATYSMLNKLVPWWASTINNLL